MRLSHVVLAILFLVASAFAISNEPQTAAADVASAYQLYQAGRFSEAEAAYAALLKADPSSAAAAAGLIRSLLRQQKLDAAAEVAKQAGAATSKSAVLLSAMGDLQYRVAQFPLAEVSYINAEKLDPNEFHAYLGLGRLYSIASLRGRAYAQFKHAHDIAPDNVEVSRAWMGQMTRRERMQALQAYLAAPHPDDALDTARMQRYLALLQATIDKPPHACKLQSKVERTEAKLDQMGDAKRTSGVGLMVKLNDHGSRLVLDTGASGILISSHAAERAGITRLTETSFAGLGDKGEQSGYVGVADRLAVGDLEYRDCLVRVSDRNFQFGDGLIGADVFENYVVDIDIQAFRLRLSPLPKRPGEQAAESSLSTAEEDEATDSSQPADKPAAAAQAKSERPIPQDRYIAPEMADWSKIFRIGHQLLIPTRVNDTGPDLFLIDTGSSTNLISERVARSEAKVHGDDYVRLRGMSGSINKVYAADAVVLQFGKYRQKNQEALTIDLSGLSRNTGTEVGGILGFTTLHLLDVKIDYRDGLVDFSYNPNPLQRH